MASLMTSLREAGKTLLKIAEKKGLDEAEAYLVSNKVLTVRLVNNSVFEAKGVHDIGVGLRVIKGNMLGFSSTADFSKKSLEKLVEAAASTAKARKLPFKYSFPKPRKIPKVAGVYDKKLAELPSEKAVDLAYQMVEASLSYSKKIKDNAGVLNVVSYETLLLNTHGVSAKNSGTFFEASLSATAKSGKNVSEGSDATAGRRLKELKPKEVGEKAAEMAVSGLKSKKLKEDTYTVILDYEPASGVLGYVSMLVSPMIAKLYFPLLLDKMGKKIASQQITLIDDPLMPNGVGSAPVDDEGTPSKKKIIINKGVLKAFVYDSFYGAIEKKKTTGNAVRASFAVGVSSFPGKNYNGEPIPVPRNPYFKPGKWKREEILEETKQGLLVRRFHYTRLTNPTRGDFTSVLRMGLYAVKNGEVAGALKKSRLIDNLLNMLQNVDAVSDKLVVAGSWGDYAHTPIIRTKAHVAPID
ncbi:MAG TPA: TldD/PmbA family protein [Candidatus Bathyarchaeota archaeon]|nr:TldD/PmbA family protein [Candidatus Bathyarchaeota archaeon]HEX69496.1 TldD/PmbA family protein [Candidatus Bathyarchaeota archaeon]